MKILFISPSDDGHISGNIIVQPLGLMYIVSALRERFNHDIRILDMKIDFMSYEGAYREAAKFSPDVIGIRALTCDSKAVHTIAEGMKKTCPDCKFIVGGPYTQGSSKSILQDPNVDFVVIGEGEVTVCELMAEIEKGNEFPDINGIGYIRDGEIVITPPREPIMDLDSISFPAWDLIDMEKYFKIPAWNYSLSAHMAIFTSRGCPYKCAYCHNIFGKKPRLRSPQNILEEIEILHDRYGVRELRIIDDIFNVNKPRLHKVCDMIVEKGFKLNISFPNGLRGDIMDKVTLQKLKQAGTYDITYAVETASPRLQKLIKKNINLPKLKEVIKDTVEAGIFTRGFFMMGFPSETREEILSTAQYALSSKLHWMKIFVVNPYEGTELADLAASMGIEVEDKNLDFSKGYNASPLQLSEVPVQEIIALERKTKYKFFFNPRRIFSSIKCSEDKKKLFSFVSSLFIRAVLSPARGDKLIRWGFKKMYDWRKKTLDSKPLGSVRE